MLDLAKRIANLPADRRAAVLDTLRRRAPAEGSSTRPIQPAPQSDFVLETTSPSEPSALKASYKRFYDTVTTQLNATPFGRFSFFLNYGYLPDGSPEFAQVEPPEHCINRNSVKLVLEVVGDLDPTNKHVLDVGCGRGGTIHVLKTYFKPATLTGLDLSTAAISFCRSAHGDARTSFHEGDAEHLPFPDASFEIVTNIESSHSYPSIHRFYSEVARVLVPGGYFLYTDALLRSQIAAGIAYLEHAGLVAERSRDITRNVLLSCDAIAQTRIQAFDGRNDREVINNFLATPGSQVYEDMQTGRWEYHIFRFRKQLDQAGRPGVLCKKR
jgi:phthiocerol/phenolphthiocerol synthesis type-I polyketide synthase E